MTAWVPELTLRQRVFSRLRSWRIRPPTRSRVRFDTGSRPEHHLGGLQPGQLRLDSGQFLAKQRSPSFQRKPLLARTEGDVR
ncbi:MULTISPECIES: hypothetical protein [unclassified Streptomyces]|uniref:hypothetical protein n=1 Tax=unclassified Streptomyces TaxID=2593676 RepID=UPI0022561053|nr:MULTISPECIES: hypothetical protein [unclassified Streptomyces]MCX5054855.1 hypothetical protein [Streptomyces sp. NBC_00474]